MSADVDTFRRERPEITEQDAIAAGQAMCVIQSFNAHPISDPETGIIPCVAIKWKLGNGTTETVLISHYAAGVLRMMLSHLEENNWTEMARLPPDATPQ